MKNYKELKKELRNEFGKDWYWFNDKNKHTRRIKIVGTKKHKIKEYLANNYPGLVMWETTGGCYGGYYDGVCFNLEH